MCSTWSVKTSINHISKDIVGEEPNRAHDNDMELQLILAPSD